MKILIDIGHPAHVHLFKNFARIMSDKGHNIQFTVRDKEYEIALLKYEKLSFINLGKHYRSKRGKIFGLLRYNLSVLKISLKFKPDLFLSHGSVYTLLSSFVLKKPNIAFEDTGNKEQVRLYLPFTRVVLTSKGFPFDYGRKQVNYDGYHELAYLHPDYFKPDAGVLHELGISKDERFFILRFVSWDATHDFGRKGFTPEEKRKIIKMLLERGKVFISSEAPLPPDLECFRFPLTPDRMHHALAFAHLFVGEGVTMASESAILGTKAICVNKLHPVYLELEVKYNLVCNFISGNGVLDTMTVLLKDENLKEKAFECSRRLLNEKIDVTSFLVNFIENFPARHSQQKQG